MKSVAPGLSIRLVSNSFSAVYFDCDSTLSSIEGVDQLLQFADPDLRQDIAVLTDQAMNGTLPLAEVYETRLSKLAPSRDQLNAVGEHYVRNLVPDAKETIMALQALGKHVGIVSGGLLIPVQRVAQHLGVPLDYVHAVPLLFSSDGRYRDFDRESPLWRNGGKVPVVKEAPDNHKPMVFVGDGITDLETMPHVGRFVGFGGVVAREVVRDGADYWVEAQSLASILPFILTKTETDTLRDSSRFRALLA